MIFLSNSQLNTLLIFVCFGIFIETTKQFFALIFNKYFSKKIIKTLFFSIFCTFFCIIFVCFVNFFNFGKYSPVLFLACLIGIFLIKSLYSKSFVLLKTLWYNLVKKSQNNTKDKVSKNAKPNQD